MKKCTQFMAVLLILFSTGSLYAQQRVSTTGKVLSEDGTQLESTTITVVNVNTGAVTHTISDSIGVFTIGGLVPSQKYNLFFEHVGYEKDSLMNLSFSQTENSALLIRMRPDASSALGDIVVTALGIKRSEKALSYNVQQIKQDELTTVKDANFVNSLNGKVAGVTINRSSSGIGGATKVVMRGTKSIVGNNNVLYVIDGMPVGNSSRGDVSSEFSGPAGGEGISDLNPEDIESISVLTGPSAAALYGAAAANGVMLINTRRGAEGRLRVNFSSNNEFLSPLIMPEFQNKYGNRAGEYRSWGDSLVTPSSFNPKDFFRRGYNTINSLNLSTGTTTNQTFFSVASTNSQGIIPNNEYYRYNFTIRNTATMLNDKLHTDFGASYILQGDQNMLSQGRYFNPLLPLYLFPRGEDFENVKIFERYDAERRFPVQYWPYGDQGLSFENPYWTVNREMFISDKTRYMLHARAQYDILSWMNIAGRVRVDNTNSVIQRKLYASTLQLFTNSSKGSYHKTDETYKQTYADVMLNINKRFTGGISLTANVGSSFEDHYTTGVNIGGRLFTVPNLFSANNFDPSQPGAGETYLRTRNIAAFASAELGWKNRLFLTTTGRTDWASQLVSNGKTTPIFYPSIGLSGILSDMIDMPDFISYLKARGSYTEVGSPISQVGITPGTVTDPMSGGTITPISTYPYPDFKPERTKSYEFGINSRFLNNKISFDATLYQSNTYNQTFLASMSAASGYSGFYVQAGNVRNRGVEMALGYKDNFGGFEYSTNFTFTKNLNKIIEMVHNFRNPIDSSLVTFTELTLQEAGGVYIREGYSMSDIFVQGILERGRDGHLIPEGNGFKVDRSQRIKVGSVDPDFSLGWRNDLSFKNVSLGALVTGRFGGVVTSQTQAFMDAYGVSKVSADARDNGGVEINGVKYNPERYYNTVGGQSLGGYYVYDATIVKLQELSLSYSLPKKWLGNIFTNASVGLIGRNLFIFYRKAPYDPEMTSSTGTYNRGDYFMPPSLRSLGFSLKVSL
ncbi:SusC/RagA family TonB-linked outer membrane protein [Haoranjiania flava]|uniref:SusC/RagA family TonB-linked outer membrane protein n=1 Tax=Haoranjiania flava TaxID=1856322 RepID=A0AAE3IJY8_9BACT|nr:SusC/RagA family TonB-linked outer membrane protein [Haoranjiania flava]MCU7693054.1 SusC/RagA family TonB-linked outer membrane protein [Haoranjiania flava]